MDIRPYVFTIKLSTEDFILAKPYHLSHYTNSLYN